MPSDRNLFVNENPPPEEDLMFGGGLAGSDDPDDDQEWFGLPIPNELIRLSLENLGKLN